MGLRRRRASVRLLACDTEGGSGFFVCKSFISFFNDNDDDDDKLELTTFSNRG